MSGIASAARVRILPHGPLDLLRQLAIWFGFLYAYRYTRGVADRDPFKAFHNGLAVADLEHRFTGLWELSLLWIYLWRNEAFVRVRNTLLLANIIGLLGFVLVPTAPPRMFPELGFVDTLAGFGINHDSAIVRADANPYAAMPSLHAADALIIGVALAFLVRPRWLKALWILWPGWVWFSVMATGNHFWLDIVAGIIVAIVAGAIVNRKHIRRLTSPAPAPA